MFAPQALNAIRIFGMRIKELLFGKRVAEHRVVQVISVALNRRQTNRNRVAGETFVGAGHETGPQCPVRDILEGYIDAYVVPVLGDGLAGLYL